MITGKMLCYLININDKNWCGLFGTLFRSLYSNISADLPMTLTFVMWVTFPSVLEAWHLYWPDVSLLTAWKDTLPFMICRIKMRDMRVCESLEERVENNHILDLILDCICEFKSMKSKCRFCGFKSMSVSFKVKVSIVLRVDKTNFFLFQESGWKMLMTHVVCRGVYIFLPNQMLTRMSNSKSFFSRLWCKVKVIGNFDMSHPNFQ